MLAARVGIGVLMFASGAIAGFTVVHVLADPELLPYPDPPGVPNPEDALNAPKTEVGPAVVRTTPTAAKLAPIDLPAGECVAEVTASDKLVFARTTAKVDYAIDRTGVTRLDKKIPAKLAKTAAHPAPTELALDAYSAHPPAAPIVDARGRVQLRRDLDDTEATSCVGPLRAIRSWSTSPGIVELEYAVAEPCAAKVARVCQLASVP